MKTQRSSTHRQGQLYHFSVNGTSYTAFIWEHGKQFEGRVEGNPHAPHCKGRTVLAVRDALQAWLADNTST